MNHPTPSSRLVYGAHCAHLRHKGMYVTSLEAADAAVADSYHATSYWCTCTQKALGPDGQPVAADRGHPGSGRACCAG